MNFWIGHTQAIKKILLVDRLYLLINAHMMAKVMEVQAPTSMTVGYLLMLDAITTNYEELTSLVQEYKYFEKMPIKIKTQELHFNKNQLRLD